MPAFIAISAVAAALGCSTPSAGCSDVLDYASWHEAPDQQWDHRVGSLTIIGAEHLRDPAHAQFARIAGEFAKAKPTVVYYEGPNRGERDNAEAAIREGGESGFVRFLASKARIPARSLEMGPADQIKLLTARFPPDQIQLFFVLREAARLRDRENLSGVALETAVTALLRKAVPLAAAAGVSFPFHDIAGLQHAFARYWPGRDWTTVDANWFSPTADAAGAVTFTFAINRADSENRNRAMVQLFAEAVAAGERPFVVVGRNHVPMIAPALDCRISEIKRAPSPQAR